MLCSQSVYDKASDRAFLFFRNDHAIRFVLQKEGTGVPRALVLGTLLLKYLCLPVVKVYEDIAIIFNTAKYVLLSHLLIVRHANQVDAPAAQTIDLSQRIALF